MHWYRSYTTSRLGLCNFLSSTVVVKCRLSPGRCHPRSFGLGQWVVSSETEEERQKSFIEKVKLDRRTQMLQYHRFPAAEYKVAGVSFNDRQSILQNVRSGDVVLFEREPHNQYDSNAVRVSLLDGRRLGYVPRDRTTTFGKRTTAGRVKSVGMGQGGYYGATVYVQPRLPFLLPPFLPDFFSHLMDPFREVQQREQVMKDLKEKGKNSCCLTGVTNDLYPIAFWRVHEELHCFDVVDVDLVQRDFASIAQWKGKGEGRNMGVFTAVNGWTTVEAEIYLNACMTRKKDIDAEWTVNTTVFDQYLKKEKNDDPET